MFLAAYLMALALSSPTSCPFSCPCGCCAGSACDCGWTCGTGVRADAIETATQHAEQTGINVVIEVGGMDSRGLPGTAWSHLCRVDAVEDVDGPCVYVGHFESGHIREWTRYRPQPQRVYYYAPPPPPPMPVFFPTIGGFGGCAGGCCGGCCR